MSRLRREAIKTKDILSANKIASVKIPDLTPGFTLEKQLYRDEFVQKSSALLDRVSQPITEALEKANVAVSRVEILGGGLRIPAVQDRITQTVG